MTLITQRKHNQTARGSQARAAVELANVTAALALSRNDGSAGLVIGTTTSKVKVATITPYLSNGAWKSLAVTDDAFTLSGTVVAAGSFQKYLLLVDSAGTASIQEGTQSTIDAAHVAWSNVSNVSPYAALLSILNAGKTIIGYITVATDATHTFTPGTTALTATGITTTYSNAVVDPTLIPCLAAENGLITGLAA